MTYLTHDEENDFQRLERKLQAEGQLNEDEWKYLELLRRKRRGDFSSGGDGMERSASAGSEDPKPSRGSEGNTPGSGQNEDRDDQTRLFGAEAEKLLSPQGREHLEQDRKDRANDPCPRKALRESASLLSAVAYRKGISIPQPVRIELWECGLEDQDIGTWDHLRLLKRRGVPFTPEQEQEYERICRLVERCLGGGCDGGSDPPDTDSGPDDSGPDITDGLGVQDVEDDADEAEPTTALPLEEPAPVQVPVPMKPKDKKKKPKPPAQPPKKGGVDFP